MHVYVRVCNSPVSWGSHAGLVIVSHYPPGESLQLIIARSIGKAVTFHTPHIPSSCSRMTVTGRSLVKTLHLKCSTNLNLLNDRLGHYQPSYWAVCVCVCVCNMCSSCACMPMYSTCICTIMLFILVHFIIQYIICKAISNNLSKTVHTIEFFLKQFSTLCLTKLDIFYKPDLVMFLEMRTVNKTSTLLLLLVGTLLWGLAKAIIYYLKCNLGTKNIKAYVKEEMQCSQTLTCCTLLHPILSKSPKLCTLYLQIKLLNDP